MKPNPKNDPLRHPLSALLLCLFVATTCRASEAGDGATKPTVSIVQAPAGCLVPDAVVDSQGTLHLVYGLNHQAYYIQSRDNGKAFTHPVKINSDGKVETKMGERGPKLAVDPHGVIHVCWMDEWAPGVKTFVRYARSVNHGASFGQTKAVSSMSGVDGATLTADAQRNVLVFWHVMADPKPDVKAATWLYHSRSIDGGANFGASEKLPISNLSGLACSMCMMRARTGPDGAIYLALRSAQTSIRDFYVLKSPSTGRPFTAIRVNQDNWAIDYCPMCGPELTFGPDGQALCAFMTRNQVYWALAAPAMRSFQYHVGTPTPEPNEIYPSAIANRKGEVLFVWQLGPMAVKGTATVKWSRYDRSGKPTGESGTAGTSFAGTKSTAFVGTDDNFYIVTTTR